MPTEAPTASPTTLTPTSEPTAKPSLEPTTEPTVEPTAAPSTAPTAVPTFSVATVEAKFELASGKVFGDFNKSEYISKVADAANIEEKHVAIATTIYSIEILVDITGLNLDDETLAKGIAKANKVPEENAEIINSPRRLGASGAQHLAAKVAVISTQDLGQANSALTSSSNISKLSTALGSVTNSSIVLPPQTLTPTGKISVTSHIEQPETRNKTEFMSGLIADLQSKLDELQIVRPGSVTASISTDASTIALNATYAPEGTNDPTYPPQNSQDMMIEYFAIAGAVLLFVVVVVSTYVFLARWRSKKPEEMRRDDPETGLGAVVGVDDSAKPDVKCDGVSVECKEPVAESAEEFRV